MYHVPTGAVGRIGFALRAAFETEAGLSEGVYETETGEVEVSEEVK